MHAPSQDRHPTRDSNLNWKRYALSTWRVLPRITLANTFVKIVIIIIIIIAIIIIVVVVVIIIIVLNIIITLSTTFFEIIISMS